MELVRVLESYRGRDKIIRLCSYIGMFISGDRKAFAFDRIRFICGELGQCRVILRLFDDLPMLLYNLSYGTGSKEKSTSLRILNLLTNIANQSYYPIEHIAWLADRKVLNTEGAKWWMIGIFVWATSLFTEILKQIVKISIISKKLQKLKKQQYLESSDESREEPTEGVSAEAKSLKSELFESRLILIQSASDFMNAINWCPPGFLWSGKLSRSMSGVFGMLSTSIMLYRNWPAKK